MSGFKFETRMQSNSGDKERLWQGQHAVAREPPACSGT